MVRALLPLVRADADRPREDLFRVPDEAPLRVDRPRAETVRRLRDSPDLLPVPDLLLELRVARLREPAPAVRDLLLAFPREDDERALRDREDAAREELVRALLFDLCAMKNSPPYHLR